MTLRLTEPILRAAKAALIDTTTFTHIMHIITLLVNLLGIRCVTDVDFSQAIYPVYLKIVGVTFHKILFQYCKALLLYLSSSPCYLITIYRLILYIA